MKAISDVKMKYIIQKLLQLKNGVNVVKSVQGLGVTSYETDIAEALIALVTINLAQSAFHTLSIDLTHQRRNHGCDYHLPNGHGVLVVSVKDNSILKLMIEDAETETIESVMLYS